jgi:hypothetical protein
MKAEIGTRGKMKRELLVESIRIDGKTQSRAGINRETVTEYAEAMAVRATGPRPPWPAVTVFFDGTEYWMADGFHRLLAAKEIGRKNISSDVQKGTRDDAAWAACAANLTHGLRRTNADKRRTVEIALKLHPEMSARAISGHCGVNDQLVRDVRSRCGIPAPDRVVGTDGKSYPAQPATTAKQGPPPAAKENIHAPSLRAELATAGMLASETTGKDVESEKWTEDSGKHERGSNEATGDGGRLDEKDESTRGLPCPVDDVGRTIPEELLPLWGRRREVQDLMTALSRVRVALRSAQEMRDPLFSEIPFSSALAHLDQAYDAVQVAKPYAVCAFCQGHGCEACRDRGLLSKFRWDSTVPREHKEAVGRLVDGGQ